MSGPSRWRSSVSRHDRSSLRSLSLIFLLLPAKRRVRQTPNPLIRSAYLVRDQHADSGKTPRQASVRKAHRSSKDLPIAPPRFIVKVRATADAYPPIRCPLVGVDNVAADPQVSLAA